jgi:hypothetical protein
MTFLTPYTASITETFVRIVGEGKLLNLERGRRNCVENRKMLWRIKKITRRG